MPGLVSVLSVSAGTLLAIVLFLALVFWYVKDITQKKHTVLRNYPVIGRLRYFFEQLGEYFRQYFFTGDREEMPFNRSTRAWVYRLAKNEGGVIGFGSTYNLREPGALVFVNAPFAVLEEDQLPTPPLAIGEGWCERPFLARSVVNISGMSYGAISKPAVRALSRGAAAAGCWMDTGEGGLSSYHLEGGSGAAPQALADHMALSIDEALPRVVDALIETGLRDRVRVIAAGKLVTSARAAWALAAGADFVNTARGFMFALGCIQALRCHANTCPAGVTTHNPRLQRGLVVEDKAQRVAHYCRNMNKEIDMIAHSCGLRHAREFRREHVRIVQPGGQSVAFNMLYPYPAASA